MRRLLERVRALGVRVADRVLDRMPVVAGMQVTCDGRRTAMGFGFVKLRRGERRELCTRNMRAVDTMDRLLIQSPGPTVSRPS